VGWSWTFETVREFQKRSGMVMDICKKKWDGHGHSLTTVREFQKKNDSFLVPQKKGTEKFTGKEPISLVQK